MISLCARGRQTWPVLCAVVWLSGCATLMPGQGDPTAGLLRSAREEPNPHKQIEAMRKLRTQMARASNSQHEQAAAELSSMYYHFEQAYLKSEILLTLAEVRSQQAEETLTDALDHRDATVRAAACDAWARRKGPAAIEALAMALNEENELDVRLAAAKGLANFKDPAARDALARSLTDTDPAIQLHVMRSLRAVTGQPYLDVDGWQRYLAGQPRAPTLAERSGQLLLR